MDSHNVLRVRDTYHSPISWPAFLFALLKTLKAETKYHIGCKLSRK